MNRKETAQLLAKIAAFDQRTVGDGDVLAWHEALSDLPYDLAAQAVSHWHGHTETSRRMMPANVRRVADDMRRGLVEREHSARVTGHETDAALLAQARRAAVMVCGFCDDEGWINGRQLGDDGQTRETVIRCQHTDHTLPTGFIPDRE
ncbi:hypothetical protein SEA_JKSYNGBOY_53 [Gordonia phage JKSyngboy]|uniref:Uncharacterized protein n=1 Tax=Gordonia phage JKSyngboy TaxID=2762400 RepID=A0A7G8LLA5_9CAUD|nr:hypothetical protein J1762_gp53 [Gordonia phage JKSyngboy]QNJ58027.1 hypothetical protein SEA_JKSYNGBOY_53 [Gordonia phage JKSyngboy]